MIRVLSLVAVALLAAPCHAQFKNGFDLRDSAIDPALIENGGPGRDGIPSIDSPKFLAADEADFLDERDRVIGVQHAGVAKAYPIRILDWHEVVNDDFAGNGVLVTYCPLCGTGMVFGVDYGEVGTFGVSGLLFNSDVLLYDRRTESLWSQIMSRAISGPMKGATLEQVPARHTTWGDWRRQHPGTLVLSTDTGHRRNYSVSPYLGYARSPGLMFGVERQSDELPAKEWVLGVTVGERHKAYPLSALAELGAERFEDDLGGETLTIVWSESGNTAHALDESGEEYPTVLAFWFAWYTFHPDTEVFEVE